jgi:hypothetical protein
MKPSKRRQKAPFLPNPVKKTEAGPQAADRRLDMPGIRRAGVVFSLAMGACAMYYALAFSSVPGDFQGDSSEYLGVAAAMKSGVFTLASYNYFRGLIYPWFLSVTWGQEGFLTYFLQITLFLTSFYLALRVIALNSIYCLLPICVAMIPAVAFLQQQIYPDGILVSLTLLFLVCLAKRRWAVCIVIGVVLALTKLIFICTLPIELIVLLVTKKLINSRVLVWSVVAAVLSVPICAVLFTYAFVDLGYMVIFARPYSHGYALAKVFPEPELQVTCRGIQHTIARKDFDFNPLTVPYQVAQYGPLTQDQVRSMGCTDADVRSMKRHLIEAEFTREPLFHVKLAVAHFGKALVGAYDVGHVSGILRYRQDIWLEHYDGLSYFAPYELKLLEIYKKNGFQIAAKERPFIFALNEFSVSTGESVLRAAALGVLVWCMISGYRKRRLREHVSDPTNIGLVLFLGVYAFLVALSAPFLYDRYTLVDLVVLCILAARAGAMTLRVQPASLQPGP